MAVIELNMLVNRVRGLPFSYSILELLDRDWVWRVAGRGYSNGCHEDKCNN